MSKALISFSLILILVLGGFYIWYTYEKPQQKEVVELTNLSVYTTDSVGRLISTGFNVFQNGNSIYKGTTLSQGPILFSVQKNSFIEVKNRNLKNQNYYISTWNNSLTKKENVSRVNLKLIVPKPIKVKLISSYNKTYNFSVEASNNFQNLLVCSEWSIDYIYVKNDNYTLIKNPLNYKNYDKCYKLPGDTKDVQLKYKIWGSLNKKDYAKIIFIDEDNGMSEINGTDVYAKDEIYTISHK